MRRPVHAALAWEPGGQLCPALPEGFSLPRVRLSACLQMRPPPDVLFRCVTADADVKRPESLCAVLQGLNLTKGQILSNSHKRLPALEFEGVREHPLSHVEETK